MDLKEIYCRARQSFIDYSSGDPTSILAKEHGLLGLTRVMACMESVGLDSDKVRFTALPDFTYTRNKLRWGAGIPYGCIIKFDEDLPPFIPLDFRPNCCGIVFARLNSFNYSIEDLQKRYYQIVDKYSAIDSNDFNRRNHFMGIYNCAAENCYYFLIHGSFNFVKDALYSERNEKLLSTAESKTIMGKTFTYLIGEKAQDYYQNYLELEQKTLFYRELIASEMFPDAKIVFNRTHEGFYNVHTLLLGAYADASPFVCPIMLAPEMDLPIIKTFVPINSLYCAPHGGGYALLEVANVQRTTIKLNANYLLSYPNRSQMMTDNVLDMPFFYRTNTDRFWCSEYKMAHELDRMTPIINLKI